MSVSADTKGVSRKSRTGRVVSTGMQKTIVVECERRLRHKLYDKEVRRVRKYHVHDEREEAQVGDTVRFVDTRPLSKNKRWRLLEIIKH